VDLLENFLEFAAAVASVKTAYQTVAVVSWVESCLVSAVMVA